MTDHEREDQVFERFSRRFAAIERLVPDRPSTRAARRSHAGGRAIAASLLVVAVVTALALGRLTALESPEPAGSGGPALASPSPMGVATNGPTPAATADVSPIAIWTDAPQPTGAPCMTALLHGRLVSDAVGGLAVDRNGDRVRVVWPHGFSARSRAGVAELVDADGTVVAREGDWIAIGGGFPSDDDRFLGCGEISVQEPLDPIAPVATLPPPCGDHVMIYDRRVTTIDEDVERSSAVFVGTVDDIGEAQWNTRDGRPSTASLEPTDVLRLIEVQVTHEIAGSPDDSSVLAVPGGQIGCHTFSGGLGAIVPMNAGDQFVFFLGDRPKRDDLQHLPMAWQVLPVIDGQVGTPFDGSMRLEEFLRRTAG